MGLFGKTKVNVVVKKRTPDTREYTIMDIDYKEKDNVGEKKDGFVSAIYGREVKDDITPTRISTTPIEDYDFVRSTPIRDTGRNSADPYPEFRKVQPLKKEEELSNTHTVEVKEEIIEKPVEVQPIEEKVIESEVSEEKVEIKAQVHEYDETKENTQPEFDQTLFSGLFGVNINKNDKPASEPKKVEEKASSIFSEPEEEEDPIEETPSYDEEKPNEEEEYKREVSYDDYVLPPLNLLSDPEMRVNTNEEWNNNNIQIINQTMTSFRIDGQVKEYTEGPTFTRYAIMLGPGVPGNKITNIQLDIQRSLSVPSIRIENPIPGKPYVGIEVPNKKRRAVHLKELICTEEFSSSEDPLLIPVGLDVEGKARYVSIEDFPHGLIAGSSGSGKSVFLSCLIVSLLYKNTPEDVRFFFIDPKQVDLSQFAGIPHLISPIVTDVKDGINSLKWLIDEMERRFTIFRSIGGITKLKEYNRYCKTHKEYKKIPYIVVVIDEAADFLLNAGNEAQDIITKLVQKSRAAGIHLILAMQKPVAKVLSTTIKSNTSARFAFRVTDRMDSMLMIDAMGANDLLGKGDMMFYLSGEIGRYQSGFVDGSEAVSVAKYCISQAGNDFLFLPSELDKKGRDGTGVELDDLFADVARFVVYEGRCSMNAISTKFNVGFNRANAIVTSLEYYGIVSENLGTKARQILVTEDEIESKLQSIGVR